MVRHWFVKWWEKSPHTEDIISCIARDYSQSALDIKSIEEFPVLKQTLTLLEYPNAQANTSNIFDKSSFKSKKKNVLNKLNKKDLIKLLKRSIQDDDDYGNESEASSETPPANPYSNTFGYDSEDTPRLLDD